MRFDRKSLTETINRLVGRSTFQRDVSKHKFNIGLTPERASAINEYFKRMQETRELRSDVFKFAMSPFVIEAHVRAFPHIKDIIQNLQDREREYYIKNQFMNVNLGSPFRQARPSWADIMFGNDMAGEIKMTSAYPFRRYDGVSVRNAKYFNPSMETGDTLFLSPTTMDLVRSGRHDILDKFDMKPGTTHLKADHWLIGGDSFLGNYNDFYWYKELVNSGISKQAALKKVKDRREWYAQNWNDVDERVKLHNLNIQLDHWDVFGKVKTELGEIEKVFYTGLSRVRACEIMSQKTATARLTGSSVQYYTRRTKSAKKNSNQ